MSARIPPGYAELWYRFTVSGDAEPMYVSLGVELAVGVTPTLAQTNTLLGIGAANIRSLISSATTWDAGHVIYGNDGGDLRIEGTAAAVTGTSGATPLPPNTALLVRKSSAFGGRRSRGRMFFPGISNSGVSNAGVLAPASVTTYQTAVDAWHSALVGSPDVDAVVIFHDTAPFLPTISNAFDVQARLATQRRRLRP